MLCDRCQSIQFRRLSATPHAPNSIIVNTAILHKTSESFRRSISQGCHFCILVGAQLGATEVDNTTLDSLGAYVTLRLRILVGDEDLEPSWSITIVSRLGTAVLREIDEVPDPYRRVLDKHVAEYSAFLQNGNTDECAMPPFNIDLAKLWIEDCLRSHNQCKLGSSVTGTYPHPSRLICVKDPRNPFLIETAPTPPLTYVALSYCWGNKGQTQTLKKNFENHLARIPFATLSKTSKDAMLITRHLGYDYLWIDALCMVQDNIEDKHKEMSRMGDIYRYAVLTLCAEGSPGAQVGVLPPTPADPRELYPCTVTLAPKTTVSGHEPASRRLTVAGTRNPENFLAGRGWTLQEEALSSRALVLGRGLLAWRCACATASETDPAPRSLPADPYADDGEPSFAPARPSVEIARMRLWLYAPQRAEKAAASALPEASGGRRGRKPAFAAWYALIQGYSDRDLTNVADTLPAVDGMAAVLASSLGKPTSYFKGLWAEDLHRGLLWYVAMNDDRPARGPKATSEEEKNAEIGAPSWSWAAVGKVRVRFCSLRLVRWWTARDLGTASYDASGAKSAVEWNGAVPSAWPLRLSAPMRRFCLKTDMEYARWRMNQSYGRPGASNSRFGDLGIATEGVHPRFPTLLCDAQSPMEVVGEAALDGSSETTEESGAETRDVARLVFCVALQKWVMDSKTQWACLILEAVGANAAEYKRIGVGFIFGGACFQNDHDQGSTSYQQYRDLRNLTSSETLGSRKALRTLPVSLSQHFVAHLYSFAALPILQREDAGKMGLPNEVVYQIVSELVEYWPLNSFRRYRASPLEHWQLTIEAPFRSIHLNSSWSEFKFCPGTTPVSRPVQCEDRARRYPKGLPETGFVQRQMLVRDLLSLRLVSHLWYAGATRFMMQHMEWKLDVNSRGHLEQAVVAYERIIAQARHLRLPLLHSVQTFRREYSWQRTEESRTSADGQSAAFEQRYRSHAEKLGGYYNRQGGPDRKKHYDTSKAQALLRRAFDTVQSVDSFGVSFPEMGSHYGVVECYDNEAVEALLNTIGYGLGRPSFSHLTDLRLAVPTTRDVGLLGTALAPATKASLRHLLLIITDRTGAGGAFGLAGYQHEQGNEDGAGGFEQYPANMPSNWQYAYPNRAPCHEAAFWRFVAECGNLESLGIQATHYLDLDQLADSRPGRGLKVLSLSRLWTSTHSLLQLLSAGATGEGQGRPRSPIRRVNLDDVKIKAPPPGGGAEDPLATETWARVFGHLAETGAELQFCRAAHLGYFKAHPAFRPRPSTGAAPRKPWSRHAADSMALEALLQVLVQRAGGPMAYPDDATECLGLRDLRLDDASARELEEWAAFPESSCSPS